ncbi:MAG: ABC transporter permease subunit [bacterium]
MFGDVFRKTLYDQRRAIVGWGLGVAAMVLLMAAIWPSVRDVFDEELLSAYPEVMRELFDIDAIVTGSGFLNAELFSILLPALFIAYGIGRGARLVAGEEQDGTLEVVIVSPASRARILLHKAAALALGTIALGVVLFAATLLASFAADMGIPVAHAAIGALAMVLIGVQHGWLALAVGAASGRRVLAVAVAATFAVMGYVLHVIGALVEAVEPWQPLSPFTQAIDAGPVSGTVPAGFLWLALSAIVFVAAALPRFDRRDIATA